MKKNTKIGLGLAMVSAISLAAAFPVFADVKPNTIDTVGNVMAISSSINVDEKVNFAETKETVNENGAGDKEDSVKAPDFEKSPNFCRVSYDTKELEKIGPEAKPSDYKDETIRKYAEEYKAKGYWLTDSKYSATKHGSGFGSSAYVFCNGFSAVDNAKGNNTFYIEVVKCAPEEFKWYLTQFDSGSLTVSKNGKIEQAVLEDACNLETLTYDPDTEVLVINIQFKTIGVG